MGNKKLQVNTPMAFYPEAIPVEVTELSEEDGDVSEEKFDKMRQLLKEYEELNKLYDLCIKRIQSRSEK